MRQSLIILLAASCTPAFAQRKIDAVTEGKLAFGTYGCIVCHSVDKKDVTVRTGPNLYGLFLNQPREREVAHPETGDKRKIKADKNYYTTSVRTSWDALAVAERGAAKGQPFPKIMPMYALEVIPDASIEYIWHYLRTLADEGQAGPAKVELKEAKKSVPRTLVAIPNEVLVTKRTRVFRAPLRGSSARALHVGQPNGFNYTFDARVLGVRNIWSGGFLNLSEERKGRARPGSTRGQGHKVFLQGGGILQPLLPSGEPVDFEFKEPDVLDHKAIERWLWEDRDFPELLATTDAEFEGHRLDLKTGDPVFSFRVGRNAIQQGVKLTDDGQIVITLLGGLKVAQKFKVSTDGLTDAKVQGGALKDGVWTVGPTKSDAVFSARLAGGIVARLSAGADEDWSEQPLVVNTEQLGRKPMEVPAGYRSENWEPPKDIYGRKQLFEATGIAVAKDGTIVLATRTAGIWRIRKGKWSLFAEGTYECLGVWIEDDKGDSFVVMQKPELTRITDTNGDGRADQFETVCDDYGFHGNYHEFAHGPVRDSKGNYYFTLNLSHGGSARTSWRAGGPYMGSMGGYRGWACRVTPEGKFEPFANGLRSPAGLGTDPDGRIWYSENQGEYVGSSKVVPLEQDKFYGHLSGLVSLPGKKNPDSPELKFDLWKGKIRKGAVWLPHGKIANAPGHPVWDTTGGKFGVFQGQMFMGDQTMSNLFRVVPERVKGIDQGSVTPFARFFASGVMRPVFLDDGSMLIGQTGRGWGAWGGQQGSLQRIIYDGKTVAADIHHSSADSKGFRLFFTHPISGETKEDELKNKFKIQSWFYTNTGRYGSPEHDRRDDLVERVEVRLKDKSVLLVLKDFGEGDTWLDRIYHIRVENIGGLFGDAPTNTGLGTYFTLRVIP
ncbi:MAG: c-type cytochrome [Verrucomicrobia bacterium]|nr:c-type cytochrome [Verrucomicrobiota bacterium]MDA0723057.1 c-type cytochrome [Verrucomicrobiota bacterium]MDA1045705.1 c-type cytochrome [Verrucomicrobiota bacterium]